jgi:alkylation response protein AidB-like acyl-CoA dehydrogenase
MIPEEYGGSFSDVVTYGIICEELARVDWVVASVVSVTNSLVGGSILRHGTDAQKDAWLPRLARGEVLTSACLTEPGGGTDLGNLKTTATRVDGGYRLSGTKVFISHADHAGLFFVVASLDLAKKHKGVTAFLVDPHATDGIQIGHFPMRTLAFSFAQALRRSASRRSPACLPSARTSRIARIFAPKCTTRTASWWPRAMASGSGVRCSTRSRR